jgi:hypothetical protein
MEIVALATVLAAGSGILAVRRWRSRWATHAEARRGIASLERMLSDVADADSRDGGRGRTS